MENLPSEGMNFKEHVRIKTDTLIVFNKEMRKELDSGNTLFASMYQDSINDLLIDLTSHFHQGRPEIDYIKEELENRGLSVDEIIPDNTSSQELSM